jgi:hypothetical protein
VLVSLLSVWENRSLVGVLGYGGGRSKRMTFSLAFTSILIRGSLEEDGACKLFRRGSVLRERLSHTLACSVVCCGELNLAGSSCRAGKLIGGTFELRGNSDPSGIINYAPKRPFLTLAPFCR